MTGTDIAMANLDERYRDMVVNHDDRLREVEKRVGGLEESLDRVTSRFNRLVDGDKDTGSLSLHDRMTQMEGSIEGAKAELAQVKTTLQRVMWVIIGAAVVFILFGQDSIANLLLTLFGG